MSQKATGDQEADVAEDLTTDSSLWDRAYDTLKDEESNLIAVYEIQDHDEVLIATRCIIEKGIHNKTNAVEHVTCSQLTLSRNWK